MKRSFGEGTPDKLLDIVLFLLGIHLYLRTIEDHYNLRCDTPLEKSQITFGKSETGIECLVYRKDDSSLNDK